MFPGPQHCLLRMGIEVAYVHLSYGSVVVVACYYGIGYVPYSGKTPAGFCSIAYDITDTKHSTGPFFFNVFQNGIQGLKIAVYVTQHGNFESLDTVLKDIEKEGA